MNTHVARVSSIAVLVGLLRLGASTEAGESAALVRHGTTYGECLGYCSMSIEVFSTRVTFSATALGPTQGLAPFSNGIALNRQEQGELRRLIAGTSVEGLPERIGCPDCDDSGAEWIEIPGGGHPRRITFEAGRPPVQLKPLIDWLSAMQHRFQVPSVR
jgi:hypothetical protein